MSLVNFTNRGVSFNGSNLETAVPGLVITKLPARPPVRDVQAMYLARTDNKKVSSDFYKDRKVNLIGYISTSGRPALDDSLDTLNKILQPREESLIVPYGNSSREFTCTFDNISLSNMGGGYVEFEIEFTCSDSMGYDLIPTTLLTETIASGTESYPFNLGGSAEWQYPTIQLILIAISGGTDKTITLGNHDTGQSISLTRTWSDDDVLEIDTLNRTVKVNDVDADFSGAFPAFKLPSGELDYTDGLTTRTIALLMTYKKRYI